MEGTSELEVDPDIIQLSFRIEERSMNFDDAMEAVLKSLAECRAALLATGVLNTSITSDSVGSTRRECENKKGPNTVEYEVSIVVRVSLEEDAVPLFGAVMLAALTLGHKVHNPPTYDVADLTDFRHQAREGAMTNALEKALVIVRAMNRPKAVDFVTLGAPVMVSDLSVDIKDDADDSWCGNTDTYHYAFSNRRRDTAAVVPEPSSKKHKLDHHGSSSSSSAADSGAAAPAVPRTDLFQVAPVSVSAVVQVIFELKVTPGAAASFSASSSA